VEKYTVGIIRAVKGNDQWSDNMSMISAMSCQYFPKFLPLLR